MGVSASFAAFSNGTGGNAAKALVDIDCSTNPNYPAGTPGDRYRVSVAGMIGGALGGQPVEVDDRIECVNTNAGGAEGAVGGDWNVVQKNIWQLNETQAGWATEATAGEAQAMTSNTDVITARRLSSVFTNTRAITQADSPYAALDADRVITVDTTGGDTTITLPTVASAKHEYIVQKVSVDGNNVIVDGNGAETINGAANLTWNTQWDTHTFVPDTADGTRWIILYGRA